MQFKMILTFFSCAVILVSVNFFQIDDFVLTGILPKLVGNTSFVDITDIALNHIYERDTKRFLSRSVIAQVTAGRSQAISMWEKLRRTYYEKDLLPPSQNL